MDNIKTIDNIIHSYVDNDHDNAIFLNYKDLINLDITKADKIKINNTYNYLLKSQKKLRSSIKNYENLYFSSNKLLKSTGSGLIISILTTPLIGAITAALTYEHLSNKENYLKSDDQIFKTSINLATEVLKHDLEVSECLHNMHSYLKQTNTQNLFLREKIYATNKSLSKVIHEGITLNVDDPWQRHGLRHIYFKKNNAPTLVRLK